MLTSYVRLFRSVGQAVFVSRHFFMLTTALLVACREAAPRALAADTTAVRGEVEQFMAAHYTAFERGDMSAWTDQMVEGVFLAAADPAEALAGRAAVLAEMKKDFEPAFAAGFTLAIRPTSHGVWVSDDGRTAAATYGLDYTATIEGKAYPLQLRSTSLLSRDSAGWKVLAAHYSRPIALDSLFLALVSRRVPIPAPVGMDITAAAGEVAQKFRADLADISTATFMANVVAVTPGSIVRGSGEVRAALMEWLGPPGNVSEREGGARAALAPSPTVGWVAANLNVSIFAGPERAVAPVRALFVYHLENNRWLIIQVHLSVGLADPA